MARLSKCKKCERHITKEEKYIISGKGYCKSCHDIIQSEKQDYKNLLGLICQYFNINEPTGLMFKQIKEYKDQFNYSYSGIGYTLWYLKEIERKNFNETKYGIAIVKYNYEKAKSYYEMQQKITNSVVDNPEIKIKEVKLNINKVYEKNKDRFTFNIDNLIGGE